MNQLTATKNRKKQSAFQKLWTQAERLKQQNARLEQDLEALVQRIQTDIQPAEREAAQADKPLLHRLIKLAQRKSLTQWQRIELDEWILELTQEMQCYSLVDQELMDDVARYDAFRLGITLDDEDIAAPSEQLADIISREQQAQENAAREAREESRDSFNERMQAAKTEAEALVEEMLDKRLGPEPAQSEKRANNVSDLWQDELDAQLELQRREYQSKRAELRKELLEEAFEIIEREFEAQASELDDEDDDYDDLFDFDFDFDEDDFESPSDLPDTPRITNQVFQRLFRTTATKLHPDREPDPVLRKKKQELMGDLLKARKKGDVMTVLALHQEYVDDQQGLSKADEKQLIQALENQIRELKDEKEEITLKSPLHWMAFQNFYFPSKNKVDRAFAEHLRQVRQDKIQIDKMVDEIKTLKTLKPWLEQRYESRNPMAELAELIDMFEGKTPF